MPVVTPTLTPRLLLRPPDAIDAALVFRRYAGDSAVTRFVGWPRHASIHDTAAFTGYVLARDAQGFGYASEALRAMVTLAMGLAVTRLFALCHPSNSASIRVLERGGFLREGLLNERLIFPNLCDSPQNVASYAYPLAQGNRGGPHERSNQGPAGRAG